MGFMRFWSDQNMWNRYGLAAIAAVAVAVFLAFVVF